MVITILEAHVDATNWSAFQNDFKTRTAELPPQMIRTYLLQDTSDQALWRIISVWKSREALEEMRNSGETPTGVLIFRNVGAEPNLSVFNVPVSAP
jgi:quinol monooxygenase YgiN